MPKPIIGILGGMGPAASALFYTKLVKFCQDELGSVQDTDFPECIIYSKALAGFDETGIKDPQRVLTQLYNALSILVGAGCSFIVIPCNTVHLFINEMRGSCPIPILSIIEETGKRIAMQSVESVVLLASETTLSTALYQSNLHEQGIIFHQLADNSKITLLIEQAMQGKISLMIKESVLKESEAFDSQAIVLGCTELPLAISQSDTSKKVFDSLQILVEQTVKYYLNLL